METRALLHTGGQLIRFGWVGACLNVTFYGFYLVLTQFGLYPQIAATIVFVCAIPLTLASHSRVTFRVRTVSLRQRIVFGLSYLASYLVNIAGLYIFVDWMKLPHQIVQAGLIVTLAGCLFLSQKYLIFVQTGDDR